MFDVLINFYFSFVLCDFSSVILFNVGEVHLLSCGEILGKVKHDLEILKNDSVSLSLMGLNL